MKVVLEGDSHGTHLWAEVEKDGVLSLGVVQPSYYEAEHNRLINRHVISIGAEAAAKLREVLNGTYQATR